MILTCHYFQVYYKSSSSLLCLSGAVVRSGQGVLKGARECSERVQQCCLTLQWERTVLTERMSLWFVMPFLEAGVAICRSLEESI